MAGEYKVGGSRLSGIAAGECTEGSFGGAEHRRTELRDDFTCSCEIHERMNKSRDVEERNSWPCVRTKEVTHVTSEDLHNQTADKQKKS